MDHFNQVPRHYTYGGKYLAFNSSCVKQSFFAACNRIYAHAKDLKEVVHLKLQESYSLPILSYAAAAVKYTTRQEDELNVSWNLVYRRIFGFNRWESARAFITGLGRSDLHHIFMLRRLNFNFCLKYTDRNILRNISWSNVHLNCSDWILLSVGIGHNKPAIIRHIYEEC